MRIRLPVRRKVRLRQPSFAFIQRRLEHERLFKRAIVVITVLTAAVILRMMPWGRYVLEAIAPTGREAARQALGIKKPRTEIDDEWRRYRQFGIEQARSRVEQFYAKAEPPVRRLLTYAGMDPEHMLLRLGNYDWTMLLSSKIFQADDSGRSFSLRPHMHSVWLRNVPMEAGAPAFFLVPDGPGLADAIAGTTAEPMEFSRQYTNSWGLRGPEPDPHAPVRGIVLGDSYMQGLFVGDGESPPDCLECRLQDLLKTRVSILNAGVMGYSPEQYYYSLKAFADRFSPQFVVVSVFINDFGGMVKVGDHGEGDWLEGSTGSRRSSSIASSASVPISSFRSRS